MNRGVNENSGRHPSDRPTRVPPLPFPCEGNGRNIFRGEENPSVNRHSRFPPVSLFENEIVRGAKVSRVLPSNNERPSYLNGEGSKPRFLRNRGGKRKETIKSAGEGGGEGRREGKRRERGKEKKGLRRDYFPEEKGGNSKAAGISSAFAWKYRSSQRIDRIFRDREIFQSTPTSPFLTFTLHYLSIVSPSASNHHRGN